MSDPQSSATPETTPLQLAGLDASATEKDTESATQSVTPDPELLAEENLGSQLDQLIQSQSAPTSWLWLIQYDQKFVGVFAAVFLILSGYHWATLGGWGMRPIELDRLPTRQYDFRIDINSASWVEWTQIEGIGEATAQKIISDREANGSFRSINDLLRVKGIGPKTLEKMRPFLRETTGIEPRPN